MKKLLIASTIVASLASFNASAQDFRLQLEHMYGDVWESLSGVIVVSDRNCDVPDYKRVTLHYYNNPSDSYYGPNFDNFTYIVNEAVLVAPATCGTMGGCIEAEFEPYIDYQDVVKSCNVYGVARLSDSGTAPIISDSRSVFDATSQRLYLTNTEIWEGHVDTEITLPSVSMKLVNGKFEITDLVAPE